MQILEIHRWEDLSRIMQQINVDPYGIKIMLPKALTYLIKINSLSNTAANILKQETLSIGGDLAISRGALTGKVKKTDCLLIASSSQISRLNKKLSLQPFGLAELGRDLSRLLDNYQKNNFSIVLGRHKLNLGQGKTCLMGIVNLTPDSFSGDGLYKSHQSPDKRKIIDYVKQMADDGADIIDVGGESSRPAALAVSIKEELSRTIPVIKALVKKIRVPISIDTYKPEVAKQALDNGAVMINDITGLRNPKMLKVAARYKAVVVIMHMKGMPQNMQKDPRYISLIDEIIEYLHKAVERALETGIDKNKIIVDPGIGFGKTVEDNLEILKSLKTFKGLGQPLLVGTSRKSFIGKLLNAQPQERLSGTIAACVLAARNGADILRVHDVRQVKQALKVTEAVLKGAGLCQH